MPTARSVLLIERDDSLRDAIAIRLRRAEFRVETVRDARAAAALLVRRRFDVVAGDRDVQEQLGDRAAGAFVVIRTPVGFEDVVRVVHTRPLAGAVGTGECRPTRARSAATAEATRNTAARLWSGSPSAAVSSAPDSSAILRRISPAQDELLPRRDTRTFAPTADWP